MEGSYVLSFEINHFCACVGVNANRYAHTYYVRNQRSFAMSLPWFSVATTTISAGGEREKTTPPKCLAQLTPDQGLPSFSGSSSIIIIS